MKASELFQDEVMKSYPVTSARSLKINGRITKLVVGFMSFLPAIAFGLVEYGAPTQYGDEVVKPAVRNPPPKQVQTGNYDNTSKRRGFKMFGIGTKYNSTSVNSGGRSGSIQMLQAGINIRTPFSFFGDFQYFEGQSSSEDLSSRDSSQRGNPSGKIGFNWLELGNPEDNARLDVYFGVNAGVKNSDFAHTRNDKIFGAETSRRILDFVVAFGGKIILTGAPDDDSEMAIGNIMGAAAAMGYVVSEDIRFSLEGNYYRVGERTDYEGYALTEALSFSTISPKLQLGISTIFELELGAHLRVKRAESTKEEEDLLDAKLFNYPGAYGNTLFAGLNLSI